MQLQIEATNVCNADCVFCNYGTMTRPKGTMKMDLFRKIIDEAATIPEIEQVTITGLGEPLLDRHLLDRIRYIRGQMRKEVSIELFTNGTFLRPPLFDSLVEAGLSVLYISLNAVTAKKRQEVMKLDDFEAVMAQTRYAIDTGRKSGKTRVVVKGVMSKDLMEGGDQDTFMNMFGGPTAIGGDAFLHLEGNWAGAIWPMRTSMTKPCHRALSQIMVLQDGRVSLCCFDGDGRDIFGDLTYQSIREIFNGGRALFVRTAHNEGRRNEIPLCANCTGI